MSTVDQMTEQLSTVGGTILQPYTALIIDLFNDMRSSITALQKRVDILEQGHASNTAAASSADDASAASDAVEPVPTTPTSIARQNKKVSSKEVEQEAKPDSSAEASQSDSKEEETAATAPPPQPVIKERGAKKKLKFQFANDHRSINQTDNGLGAMKQQGKVGTITFGKFVGKQLDDGLVIYAYEFDLSAIDTVPSGYAFGIITETFARWTESNFGENGSVMIKGNGEYLTTDNVFGVALPSDMAEENQKGRKKKAFDAFCDKDEKVRMEIDFQDLELRIWNVTRNDGNIFKASIPKETNVCAAVYMSGSKKRKIKLEEQCAFQAAQ